MQRVRLVHSGSQTLGTSPLAQGEAALDTATLAAGQRTLWAVYSGGPAYQGSTSAAFSENIADVNVSFVGAQTDTVIPGHTIAVPLAVQGTDVAGLTGTVMRRVPAEAPM